jgi:hypothetical protein
MKKERKEMSVEQPQYFSNGNQSPTTKTAIERAKRDGLKIIYPGPQQLQIDIDNYANLKTFIDHFVVLEKWLNVKEMTLLSSLSGEPGHYHVTITSKSRYFTALERISLQALLGSDLKREVLGFIMAKSGESKPTLFLEKKDEHPRHRGGQ